LAGRPITAVYLCRLIWLAWMVVWMIWALRTKQARQRLKFAEALPYMVPTAIGAYLAFAESKVLRTMGLWRISITPASWVMILGVALTAAGLLFAIWARLYLGKNWSGLVTVKIEHELVRTGPYRFVRHPIYSGILLALIGTSLCRRNLWGFAGVVLMWLGFWIKSRFEERFMVETFGSQYEDYRRTTGALIPRLP
jgi:protein-S-isoprenylcysteine O-methyltransferase Ste14